ncbi:H+-transporting two-sector ATPase, B/B' subunit (plasmid) [Cereibacter sphaeroides WS8N]|uniref:ATPase n=1 Tax=Cereibacter sphaeroides TaxID=1063 RepID=UPI00020B0204|nr:ATPase [Cereibacter sphaeroides]EGJ19488.1 H+-transporting two-sector ATPase, B/B' subunit [Cereibacter sphaeroides WS8N]
MTFDWLTFAVQIANVLILLAILRHVLFRPVAAMIAERQRVLTASLGAAEAAEARAHAAEAEAASAADETLRQRAALLEEARQEAETLRRRLLAEARDAAAATARVAEAEAARTVEAAGAETLRRARDLALAIVGRALAAQPVPPDAAGYARRLAEALAHLPPDRRAALASGAGLRLAAPAPLAQVPEVAGLPPLPVETDPALIAGLELRSANGVLHNSLAHDIGRIAEALTHER